MGTVCPAQRGHWSPGGRLSPARLRQLGSDFPSRDTFLQTTEGTATAPQASQRAPGLCHLRRAAGMPHGPGRSLPAFSTGVAQPPVCGYEGGCCHLVAAGSPHRTAWWQGLCLQGRGSSFRPCHLPPAQDSVAPSRTLSRSRAWWEPYTGIRNVDGDVFDEGRGSRRQSP